MKVSGVVAYDDPATWSVATLRPYVEHVIEAFGWKRAVWGSDWPVVTLGGTLSTLGGRHPRADRGCSEDERAALLHGNARRVWSVPA